MHYLLPLLFVLCISVKRVQAQSNEDEDDRERIPEKGITVDIDYNEWYAQGRPPIDAEGCDGIDTCTHTHTHYLISSLSNSYQNQKPGRPQIVEGRRTITSDFRIL